MDTYPDGVYSDNWWFGETGTIVRYVITGAIIAAIAGFLFGGYMHAVHRLKHKKEPLVYHRWLVSNNTRRRYGMAPIYPAGFYGAGYTRNVPTEQWSMNNWNYPPPPPAYGAPPQMPPDYNQPTSDSPYAKGESGAILNVTQVHHDGGQGSASAPDYYPPPSMPPSAQHYTSPSGPPLSQPPPVYR